MKIKGSKISDTAGKALFKKILGTFLNFIWRPWSQWCCGIYALLEKDIHEISLPLEAAILAV